MGWMSICGVRSCDMSPAFIKGVRENLPNAEVTFDKFHVTKVLGDAMEKVRRSEWRKMRTPVRQPDGFPISGE